MIKLTRSVLLISLILLIGIVVLPANADTPVHNLPDFEALFGEIDGTFLWYDQQNDLLIVHNPDRAETRYPPFSTFKIVNASIALDTETILDEAFVIPYNARQYAWDLPDILPFTEWKRDHDLRSGMQYSVVWYYIELAKLIGETTMQEQVEALGYGNMDTSAWIHEVPFWLGGSLEVTPMEQLDFLRLFYAGEAGFSERTTAIVKDIILLEETESYRLSGKTGTRAADFALGWFVGYVETDDNVYFFVLNMDAGGSVRDNLLRRLLREMGAIRE